MLRRFAIVCAVLLLPLTAPQAADAPAGELSLTGKVAHPQQFSLDKLKALASQQVQVSFQSERGEQKMTFTGVPLWALLDEAGGLADTEKGAALHHTIKITAKDGYWVVISTGEIAPDLGGKPAMITYQRDDEAPGASGFRLVMPGDKHGARYVRDVVTIDVE
ncbi:MAG TPA: hypothetical protein VNV38_13490 [Stellaceae bacterium]|jgi:hypothetical protein|nr:hypothetical protein [Stellaceae bacterium]